MDTNQGWHEEWFYIRNRSKREEAFPVFTGKLLEKQGNWSWGAGKNARTHVEAIEGVLRGLVARGLDGVCLFATIFFRQVCALSTARAKMWDYGSGELPEQLQFPGAHGAKLWGWLETMIQGEVHRAVAGPSPFWKKAPPTW